MTLGERLKLAFSVRGMRTMLVVDVLSIAAFFITLALVVRFAQIKMVEQADWIAKDHAKDIKQTIDSRLSAFINTSDAFVAGYFEDFSMVKTDDGAFSRYTVSEKELKDNYSIQGLLNVMKAGLDFMPDCSKIVLIYEPGVLPGTPKRGIAALLGRESDTYEDLLDDHDIFNHRIYKRGVQEGHSFMTDLGKVSEDSTYVVTYIIPVFSKENGRILGQFWFDLKVDDITSIISNVDMPYDSTYVLLVDQREQIVACSYQKFNGKTLKQYLRWANYGADNEVQYNAMSNAIVSAGDDMQYVVEDDRQYRLYYTALHSLKYTLFTIVLDKSVYSDIDELKSTLLSVSIIGILLMIVFTWFAFVSFSRAARARAQADSEFSLATDIQNAFLPKNIPSLPGVEVAHRYISAREVGGDLYDFHIRDGKLFFCIGDVSGKGVPAAMVMSVITNQFHNTVRYDDNPKAVMERLNDSLAERADAMMFCTMIIGVYDPSNRVLECCNAGHPRPVKLTADGKEVFLDLNTNVPIGLFSGYEYQCDRLEMAQGDTLLAYTDGITEARDVDRRFYGEERILEAVRGQGKNSPSEIIEVLTGSVAEFQSGAGQADDIASVCIKFT